MSAHDQHTSFIKTPQQLVVVVLLSFAVPITSVLLLVKLVLSQPSADPGALAPESVAARIQPVARVEFGAAAAPAGARKGEDIVKAHHGSLAKEQRLDAEQRLKHGRLKALVATASPFHGATLFIVVLIGSISLVGLALLHHRISPRTQYPKRVG